MRFESQRIGFKSKERLDVSPLEDRLESGLGNLIDIHSKDVTGERDGGSRRAKGIIAHLGAYMSNAGYLRISQQLESRNRDVYIVRAFDLEFIDWRVDPAHVVVDTLTDLERQAREDAEVCRVEEALIRHCETELGRCVCELKRGSTHDDEMS